MAVVGTGFHFRVVDMGDYGRSRDGGILSHSHLVRGFLQVPWHLPGDAEVPRAEHHGKMSCPSH